MKMHEVGVAALRRTGPRLPDLNCSLPDFGRPMGLTNHASEPFGHEWIPFCRGKKTALPIRTPLFGRA